jgi:hypothetical protein
MAEGIDYSFSRPNLSSVHSSYRTFIGRYVGPGSAGKLLTLAEAENAKLHGLSIFSLVEGYARDANLGYAKGVEQARSGAANHARCNGHPKAPLYFAVDWDANSTELAHVGSYLDGAASVIGRARVGVYGGIRTVNWCHDHGKAVWFFQTYAWSYGKISPYTHVYQYRNGQDLFGGQVDLCRSLKTNFGQWAPGTGSFGTAPAVSNDQVTPGSWDYSGVINAIAATIGSAASTVDGYASAVNGLRT